jgi:hypothetical protein
VKAITWAKLPMIWLMARRAVTVVCILGLKNLTNFTPMATQFYVGNVGSAGHRKSVRNLDYSGL